MLVSMSRIESHISIELCIIRAKLSGDTSAPVVSRAVSRSPCHLSHWKNVLSDHPYVEDSCWYYGEIDLVEHTLWRGSTWQGLILLVFCLNDQ